MSKATNSLKKTFHSEKVNIKKERLPWTFNDYKPFKAVHVTSFCKPKANTKNNTKKAYTKKQDIYSGGQTFGHF